MTPRTTSQCAGLHHAGGVNRAEARTNTLQAQTRSLKPLTMLAATVTVGTKWTHPAHGDILFRV